MRNKSNERSEHELPGGGKFKVKHIIPEGQRIQFCNHMTVQHTDEGEFILSFFEIAQPIFMGTESALREQLEEFGDTVPANCIARIAISAARIPNVVGALVSKYDNYERDSGKETSSESESQADQKHAS